MAFINIWYSPFIFSKFCTTYFCTFSILQICSLTSIRCCCSECQCDTHPVILPVIYRLSFSRFPFAWSAFSQLSRGGTLYHYYTRFSQAHRKTQSHTDRNHTKCFLFFLHPASSAAVLTPTCNCTPACQSKSTESKIERKNDSLWLKRENDWKWPMCLYLAALWSLARIQGSFQADRPIIHIRPLEFFFSLLSFSLWTF